MKERIITFYKKNKTLIRFYLLLGYFILLLFLLLHNKYSYKYLAQSFPAFIAYTAAWIIRILGSKATAAGEVIMGNNFSMRVIYDCSGIFVMVIYMAAVMAYPTSLKKISLGLLIGIPLLHLINILRLVFMFYLGQFFPKYFRLFHIYLWQGIFIVIVLFLWLLWVEKIVHYEK